MRVLILSDLHANQPATEAVLADAARHAWTRALVLGDLVGYGADPEAVIDLVRALPDAIVIRGNHDKVAAGLDDPADFNLVARHAAEWTAARLDVVRADYLRQLPRGPLTIEGLPLAVAICHGAPFDEDYYIFDTDDAARALETSPAPLVFCGHTHVQIVFREMAGGGRRAVTPLDAETIDVGTPVRTLVNPGAVGQPRDGDPRAAYAVLDTDARTIQLYRVAYDIAEAQRRIRDAGLHPSLAERLSVGR
jgi:diadenosine tetraphosphatase ApaH/serine/threonine PP2A family protein phosphatase